MTTRERWTVYPLLFLTLGITVKDKIVKLVNVDLVACKRLVVTDQQGNQQVVIAPSGTGGIIKADGARGISVVVGHLDNQAGLMYLDARGRLVGPSFSVQLGGRRDAPVSPDAPASQPPNEPKADETPKADEAPQNQTPANPAEPQ